MPVIRPGGGQQGQMGIGGIAQYPHPLQVQRMGVGEPGQMREGLPHILQKIQIPGLAIMPL
jgi:hypothetical protein